ncbi:MAG TPA: hypothetical protein VJU61_25440 [Polyangiaceae bacterium]|nr:hypothetical protein [Polyangiaceae bacterium]
MNRVRSHLPLCHRVFVGALLCWGAQACGGNSKNADDPSAAAAGKTELVWKDKNREQRTDWMATHVFPKMRAAFTEFNADRFSDFTCQTCHGERMEMDDFKMPNPSLYALSRKDTLGEARSYDAKATEFMLKTVLPEMAQLLDTEPYDREKKAGFSCFGCHPVGND